MQNQLNYLFVISSIPTATNMVNPLFSLPFLHSPQFYRLCSIDDYQTDQSKQNSKSLNQENEAFTKQDCPPSLAKIRFGGKQSQEIFDYRPQCLSRKRGKGKVYKKDQERNILPNALSKLFFYLKSTSKSEELLTKVLKNNQNIGKYISLNKYYAYAKILKSKLNKSLNEESIQSLFVLIDPQFSIFSLEQQMSFIKVNALMARYFIRSKLYLNFFVSSSRAPKDKMKCYLQKYRKILQKVEECIEQAKKRFNFDILNSSP